MEEGMRRSGRIGSLRNYRTHPPWEALSCTACPPLLLFEKQLHLQHFAWSPFLQMGCLCKDLFRLPSFQPCTADTRLLKNLSLPRRKKKSLPKKTRKSGLGTPPDPLQRQLQIQKFMPNHYPQDRLPVPLVSELLCLKTVNQDNQSGLLKSFLTIYKITIGYQIS